MSKHRQGDLFVPLRGVWFDAFEAGTKTWEHRLLRHRWTPEHVRIGRRATISRGYSGRRLYGVVVAVKVRTVRDAPQAVRGEYPHATPTDRVISFQIALGAR
jgi:hypothetical protein